MYIIHNCYILPVLQTISKNEIIFSGNFCRYLKYKPRISSIPGWRLFFYMQKNDYIILNIC